MATKKEMPAIAEINDDGITVTTEPIENTDQEPTVRIVLPLLEEGDDIRVDQTEQVIINGAITSIRRGTPVDVKVPVFMLLKQRYPLI